MIMMHKIFLSFFIAMTCFCSSLHAYKIEKFDDGLTLITDKNLYSNVVVVDFWVKTGALYETLENSGASHFMEHMFFQGTKKRPGKSADYIKKMGASFNGATSYDYVHYYIEAPKNKLEESIDILNDMLSNADINEKKFEEERGVILAELASRLSNPMQYINDTFGGVIFDQNYPYGKLLGGKYEIIEKMSISDLQYFYNTFYTKDRIAIVVTGNFDEENLKRIIKEKTVSLKRSISPVNVQFEDPHKITQKIVKTENRFSGNNSYGKIGWIGAEAGSPDFIPMLLLGYILSGGISSRLDQKIVTSGLASAISLNFSPTYMQSDFSFTFIALPENAETVKKVIINEIKDIKKGNISNEELQRMKNLYNSRFEMGNERPLNVAANLGYYWVVTDLGLYNNMVDKINKITKDDVVKVANKYLHDNNYAYLLIMPAG